MNVALRANRMHGVLGYPIAAGRMIVIVLAAGACAVAVRTVSPWRIPDRFDRACRSCRKIARTTYNWARQRQSMSPQQPSMLRLVEVCPRNQPCRLGNGSDRR